MLTQAPLTNWFPKIGASDEYLTLNETSEGVGLWRNDTWELVLRLRSRSSPIFLWIPVPNGGVVLGLRAYREAHLIWDLKNLYTVEWFEPNLLLWCEPAFTDDGSILRFVRETSSRGVEFVSRDWRRGEEQIEYSTQLPADAYFRGSRANEGITAYFNFINMTSVRNSPTTAAPSLLPQNLEAPQSGFRRRMSRDQFQILNFAPAMSPVLPQIENLSTTGPRLTVKSWNTIPAGSGMSKKHVPRKLSSSAQCTAHRPWCLPSILKLEVRF